MTFAIDRRSLLLTGALGLGAFAIPGFAQTPTIAAARGFTHGVASGEPASDSMLLWTRYVPTDGGPVELRAEIAETPDFARVVGGGAQITGPWRDHTAKITVAGLHPGRAYHYRFIAPDGSMSPVGRTRTLPEGDPAAFRMAVFSCANMPFGYFNAYAHAAARDDLHLAVHLGDYLYEYPDGVYPSHDEAVAARPHIPAHETIHLADYRLRYASYRADPALQKLHRLLPMIVQMDDHETGDDSWEGGSKHHDPAMQGEWSIRRAAALQAWHEWLPVSDMPWQAYQIGRLATLFRTDTRLLARSRQRDIAPLFRTADPVAALTAFRDGPWMDPGMTMLGTDQENWLAHAMRASVASGRHWQMVCFGTIIGRMTIPAIAADWFDPQAPASARNYVARAITAGRLGLPFNYDNWGGYPVARARFLRSAQAMAANLVVLSGDSHNAWAYDLTGDGRPVGVEFAGHSVTSSGYESLVRVDPRTVAAGLIAASPELKWCDTSKRGYMAVTLTPERASSDWVMLDTIRTPAIAASIGHTANVARGRNVMA